MKKHLPIKLKNCIGLLVASLCLCSSVLAAEPPEGVQILKYDRPADVSTLPANFRTAQSDFRDFAIGNEYVYIPTREGLNDLRISGSSFFAKNEFAEMVKKLPKKDLIVLDLRNESHGYINGDAVSWYSKYKTFNKGQNAAQIDRLEHALLNEALEEKTVKIATLGKDKSIETQTDEVVSSVMTEKEFLQSEGVKYYRIPVMDYSAPTDENIDDFVEFYKKLPKNAWVHLHCEAGVGRTTIFLSFIDMINNADKLSYDEIMTRQVLLGGEDVRKSAANAKDDYKKKNYPERAVTTKHFYDYVKAHPNLDISYSEWAGQQRY